jgi:hypothetical protein
MRIFAYNHPHVVHEDFGDETVIIHLKTGVYYNTEGSGRIIWQMLKSRPCREDVINRILLLYDGKEEEIRSSVTLFLDELKDEDLLVETDGELAGRGKDPAIKPEYLEAGKKPFVRPLIKKYTDQKELLLLDPIHEVDDLGWPEKKKDDLG